MQRIEGSQRTSVMLLDHQLKKLDRIGERFGKSRSEVLRIILDAGLESYSIYENTGCAKLAEIIKKMREAHITRKQLKLPI